MSFPDRSDRSDRPDEEEDDDEPLVHPLFDRRLELGSMAQAIPTHSGLDLPASSTQIVLPPAALDPAAPVLASNLRRAFAKLIDWTLTGILFYGIAFYRISQLPLDQRYAAVVIILLFGLAGSWFTWFVYNLLFKGDTPGKRFAAIRVVDDRARPIGFGRAVGRTWAESLSSAALLIGYLFAIFDPQKRTLHDHLAGTRVIKR